MRGHTNKVEEMANTMLAHLSKGIVRILCMGIVRDRVLKLHYTT